MTLVDPPQVLAAAERILGAAPAPAAGHAFAALTERR
jgi:hypothetical protein